MDVNVQFGTTCLPCTIKGNGICRDCGEMIIWALTPNEKFIPLEPEEVEPGVMEPHFANCAGHGQTRWRGRGRPPGQAPAPQTQGGIEMSMAIWRQLLTLIHPDRHHGTPDEKLATALTQWLLDQRPRLKRT
jgi:hypothetical protein